MVDRLSVEKLTCFRFTVVEVRSRNGRESKWRGSRVGWWLCQDFEGGVARCRVSCRACSTSRAQRDIDSGEISEITVHFRGVAFTCRRERFQTSSRDLGVADAPIPDLNDSKRRALGPSICQQARNSDQQRKFMLRGLGTTRFIERRLIAFPDH